MKSGGIDITDVKLGTIPITEVRRGTVIIWPNEDVIAPGAPTGLVVSNIFYDGFTLNWSPNPESDIEKYNVYIQYEFYAETTSLEIIINDPSLTPIVSVEVEAVDASGNVSPKTYVDVYLQLDTPAISATPYMDNGAHINVGFVNGAETIIIERATMSDFSDAVQIYSGSGYDYYDENLSYGTTYYYRAKVTSATNPDSEWAPVTVTTSEIKPTFPTNVQASSITENSMLLTWDSTTPADTNPVYNIYWEDETGTFILLSAQQPETSLLVENLAPGVNHSFMFRVYNDFGNTGFSEAHSFRTLDTDWYLFGFVDPYSSATNWTLDRLRIENGGGAMEVCLVNWTDVFLEGTEESTNKWKLDNANIQSLLSQGKALNPQPFSAAGGPEHDFNFAIPADTSWGILLRNKSLNAEVTHLEHSPVNTNALREWFFTTCNPKTSLILHNNNELMWFYYGDTPLVNSDYVDVSGNDLNSESLDNLLVGCDNNGKLNGFIDLSGNTSGANVPVSDAAQTAYDSLIAKGWTITVALDPDYQAVLDYATANSIALPDATQQSIDNQRIIDDKASGAFAKRDYLFSFSGTATPAFKLICWKRKIQAVAYGGLTWSSSGVLGNGTNGYIDPLIDISTTSNYTSANASVSWVSFQKSTKGVITSAYPGGVAAFSSNYLLPSGGFYAINSDNPPSGAAFGIIGLNSLNRVSTTTIRRITDISETFTDTYQALSANVEPYILCRNRQDNGTKDSYCDEGIAMISIGADMTLEHPAVKNIWE